MRCPRWSRHRLIEETDDLLDYPESFAIAFEAGDGGFTSLRISSAESVARGLGDGGVGDVISPRRIAFVATT